MQDNYYENNDTGTTGPACNTEDVFYLKHFSRILPKPNYTNQIYRSNSAYLHQFAIMKLTLLLYYLSITQ